ncbi:hypothetical protein [Intrasporangium sp. DVR]|uniref:hypothetical protein n=1 Tax=Intrasporangium sp. DVR TaxID=3127867 RepID=UPI00313A74E5
MQNHRSGETLRRAVFLVPAGIAVLAGLNAALLLIGVSAPVQTGRLGDLHGMLMVAGFLGTLIAMERAVALRQPLGFVAPGLLGLGAISLLTPAPLALGQLLLVDGCIALVAVYGALWRRNHDDVVLVELLGAVHLTIAAVLWLRLEVPWLMPWLVGFLVLTICAERVELARLTMPASGGRTLVLHAAALTTTLVLTLVHVDAGARASGLVLTSLVLWLVRHDVARRTVRATGLPRFSAAALLGGYAWLLLAAITWLGTGAQTEGFGYDAVVHAVMLGFAVSMVMAHAPIILPAVLKRPLPYRPLMWAPLVLMHLGLAARIIAGDFAGLRTVWQVGSIINIVALLLFFGVAAASSIAGPVKRTSRRAGAARTPSRSSTRATLDQAQDKTQPETQPQPLTSIPTGTRSPS